MTAREFARVGAHVVLVVRNVGKACQATTNMGGDFEFRHLDVTDLKSVRAFAQTYLSALHPNG